tara:strand:+ start:3377 stop:4234 length:858 start_codon:yes stop_codon:yes gene_type:complete
MIFLLFVSFSLWDKNLADQYIRDGYSVFNKAQLAELKSVDGLILGGSNSATGLSADIMSKALDEQWYNLSLAGEGQSDENYWSFIKASASEEIREKVRTIVYSSATAISETKLKARHPNLIKSPRITLQYFIPARSFASYLKTYLLSDGNNSKSKLGDGEFGQNQCSKEKPAILAISQNINENELKLWLSSQLNVLRELFPNAEIFITLPSVNYSDDNIKRLEKHTAFLQESIFTLMENNDINVTLVTQPSYPSIDMLCNDGLHASSSGRVWRTNNLLESFSSIK